ncbi:hypothetical protein BH09VER1_BH09VER1_46670 [soil metagenome]
MRRPFFPFSAVFIFLAGCGWLPAQTMENGGFEKGLDQWEVHASPSASALALKEAASMGVSGLQLKILSLPASCDVLSPKIPVTPGQVYLASLWSGGGGASPASTSIELVYFDEHGVEVPAGPAPAGRKARTAIAGGRDWKLMEVAAAAPEAARTVVVRLKPTAGAPGSAIDFDDFRIEAIPNPAPTPLTSLPTDSPRIQELKAEILRDPTHGQPAPKIVLKLDDLKPSPGGVNPNWVRAVGFAKERNIKLALGIIVQSMEPENPDFVKWVQEQNAAGRIEFWNHGWDHLAGAGLLREFSGQTYEYQKDHLTRSNELARKQLGFPFITFGAPFNATDAATVRVLSEEPNIKVWLYGDPKKTAGKTVLVANAVTIETRGRPDFEAFLEAYAHNRGLPYFVMQGHAGGWTDASFEQFKLMVDFLISQHAEFVFPRDMIGSGVGSK